MKRLLVTALVLGVVGLGAVLLVYKTTLPTESVAQFGGVSLRIEYARTPAERELGLGNRVSVPGDYGMLFVFPKDGFYGFWMKDTLVPLDMFWLDYKGRVISIAQNVATSSYPHVFYPAMPARYVLETVAGFAQEHNIATGTPLLLKDFPIVSK
jgi:uncharacterized membrane protein (UPF0127 family)